MSKQQVTINSQTMRAVYGNCGTTTCNPCSQSMIYGPYPGTTGATGPYPGSTGTTGATGPYPGSTGATGPYPGTTGTTGATGPYPGST